MTAGELATYFAALPPDLPVVATWESQVKMIIPEHIVDEVADWTVPPGTRCIVIDVEC